MPRKARDLSKPETKDVTIRGVMFTVAEFPEHEAELYDDFYHEHGGQQLDLDRQMLSVRVDQIPQSKVIALVAQKLEPIEIRFQAREAVYKEKRGEVSPVEVDEFAKENAVDVSAFREMSEDDLFESMLELAAEIDPLKDRMRHASRDMDFEKAIRLGAEVRAQSGEILGRLEAIKFDFCHTLATERKLTEMSLDEWRLGATKADKEAASLVVNTGKKFLTRSVRSKAQSVPTPTPSEEKSSGSQAN